MSALLGAAAVAAEPIPIESLKLEDLLNLEVTTVSRRLESLVKAPARTVVVTRQQIQQRRYVNLRDLLQDMPEIDVFTNYSSITKSAVSVRGLQGNNRFLILVDGMRVNALTGDEAPVEDNYPLFAAERVEVIYGPASVLYGADALMGIINIVTRREEAPHGAWASAAYGSNSSLYAAARLHASLGENVRLSLDAHRQSSQGANLAEAYPQDFGGLGELRDPYSGALVAQAPDNRFENRTSSYSVAARLEVGELTLGYDLRRYTQSTSVGVRPEFTVYGAQAPHAWERLYLTYSKEVLPGLSSKTEASYSLYRKLPSYAYINAFSGFAPSYKSSENQGFTLHQELSWAVSPILDVVGGFTFGQVHAEPETGGFSSPIDPSQPTVSQGKVISGTDLPFPFYALDYRTLGGYLQAQAQLGENLTVTAGLRYDHDTRFGHTVNPRVGAVYQFAPQNVLKLLYGESFLAPPPSYQYAFWGSFAGTDPTTGRLLSPWYHVPSPQLGPMKARTTELNYTVLATRELLVELGGYLTFVDGVIVPRTAQGPVDFAGATVLAYEQYHSEGRGQLYGGTVGLRYQGSVGPVGLEPWVSFGASHAWLMESEEVGWTEMPLTVPLKVKGGATVKYGLFSLTPRVRWASSAAHLALLEGSTKRRARAPGSTVVDAALRADDLFLPGLSLTLDVRNLLDARYSMPGSGGPLEFVNLPQDPRTVMVELAFGI